MDKSIKNILAAFLFVLIIYLMAELSVLLIPLVLAFLFSSLFQPMIIFLKRKKVPMFIIFPIMAVISLSILFGISSVLYQTSLELSEQQDYLLQQLSSKFESILLWADGLAREYFNSTIKLEAAYDMVSMDRLSPVFSRFLSSASSFGGSFFMFILYYIVLLTSMSNYAKFFGSISEDSGFATTILEAYEYMQKKIVAYMGIKTAVSIVTGLIVFVICSLFEIKFAFLWAFITFLLNFIPTIGSTIAVFPPTLMATIQFDSFNPILLLFILLVATQILMGNIIEPIIMGNTLKLHIIAVIFGLVFWGYIWGIVGMMLSVPMLVILKLLFESNPDWRPIARFLGPADEKGRKLNVNIIRPRENNNEDDSEKNDEE